MSVVRYLLWKEFKQVFRDKMLLRMMLALPIVQLLILPLAANFNVKNLKMVTVNHDGTVFSGRLIEKITSSGYFKLVSNAVTYQDALSLVEKDQADLILEIPTGLERDLYREGSVEIAVSTNAINGMKAGLGVAYLSAIIQDFNSQIVLKQTTAPIIEKASLVTVSPSFRYNPTENYYHFIVPAILVLLITVISGFMASLNIVREKENGTIEQINVTPIRKWEFILGKLIPFLVFALVDFAIGLGITRFIYGIHLVGNLGVLYLFTVVYIIAILGFGLFISTMSNTQQQAMFLSFFFIMIFILMSGMFTPTDSMVPWARTISKLIPVSHYVTVIRAIVLKGSGMVDLWREMIYLITFAVVLNAAAVIKYHKTA